MSVCGGGGTYRVLVRISVGRPVCTVRVLLFGNVRPGVRQTAWLHTVDYPVNDVTCLTIATACRYDLRGCVFFFKNLLSFYFIFTEINRCTDSSWPASPVYTNSMPKHPSTTRIIFFQHFNKAYGKTKQKKKTEGGVKRSGSYIIIVINRGVSECERLLVDPNWVSSHEIPFFFSFLIYTLYIDRYAGTINAFSVFLIYP